MNVLQNLKDVRYEIYQTAEGMAVLAFLNKVEWEQQQQTQILALEDKITQYINSYTNNFFYKEWLEILNDSLFELNESPWGTQARGSLFGQEGRLFNLISNQIHLMKNSFTVKMETVDVTRESSDISVNIQAENNLGMSMDGLTLKLLVTDTNGNILFDGDFILKNNKSELQIPGSLSNMTDQIQLKVFFEDEIKTFKQILLMKPRAVFNFEGYSTLINNSSALEAELVSLLDVERVEEENFAEQQIEVYIDAIEYPPNSYSSIRIVDGRIKVSIWEQGVLSKQFETNMEKGSGLSLEQAQQNLIRILIDQLKKIMDKL
jgi:hypothetical protein